MKKLCYIICLALFVALPCSCSAGGLITNNSSSSSSANDNATNSHQTEFEGNLQSGSVSNDDYNSTSAEDLIEQSTEFIEFAGQTGLFSYSFSKSDLTELQQMAWGISSVAIVHIDNTIGDTSLYEYDNEKAYLPASIVDPLLTNWFDFSIHEFHSGSPNYREDVDGYYIGEGIGSFGYATNILSSEVTEDFLYFKIENVNGFSGDVVNISEITFIRTDEGIKCSNCKVVKA